MPEVLELILEKGAGRVTYVHPFPSEGFKPKAWRTLLELNGDWARQALALDFKRVSNAFRERGYEEDFHWHPKYRLFSKSGEGIYIINPEEGGLARGIVQLAMDYTENPRTAEIIKYHDTNIDLKFQQDFLIKKIKEYVRVINRLIRTKS